MASSKVKAKLRLLRANSSNETDRLNQTLFVIHFENRKKAFQQEQLFLLTGAYFANEACACKIAFHENGFFSDSPFPSPPPQKKKKTDEKERYIKSEECICRR